MAAKRRPRAMPGNADPARCQWYSEKPAPHTIEVHLWESWGDEKTAFDSHDNARWRVRRCVVCDKIDTDYLMEQYKAKVMEQYKAKVR